MKFSEKRRESLATYDFTALCINFSYVDLSKMNFSVMRVGKILKSSRLFDFLTVTVGL